MTTALLIIDVQKGYITPELEWLPQTVEELQYRYPHVAILKFVNAPNSPYRKWMDWQRFSPESQEIDLAFTPKQDVPVFEKTTYSGLTPNVVDWLESNHIQEVHLCGNRTENCVLKTAVDLFETNRYRPVVLADYCASKHADLHQYGLKILEKFIGNAQMLYGNQDK